MLGALLPGPRIDLKFELNLSSLFCFVPPLSSCHEKATVALYFGRICTRLGVVHLFL